MNLRQQIFFAARPRGYRGAEFLRSLGDDWPARTDLKFVTDRIRTLLIHARDNTAYYQPYLSGSDLERMEPERILATLRQLPVLTKDVIRRNFEGLKSADLKSRNWYHNTSGGSTGEPIKLVQDQVYHAWATALTLFVYRLMGYEYGDRKVLVWGSEREVIAGTVGLRARLSRLLGNLEVLNAFMMTPERMREFLKVMNDRPAKLVVAYAQAVYELARFAQTEGIKMRPQGAMTTSAGTLYPHMRKTIRDVFQCPVYNWYGSREVGLVGTELPGRDGLWVPPWGQYVEVVDENGDPCAPGEPGSTLVTCFSNEAMPLIRYQIGDRGALMPNEGGQQILDGVRGREVDAFRRADGTLIDGEYFTHLVYFRSWVKQFQFVQTAWDRVTLKVVLADNQTKPNETELNQLRREVCAVLGPNAELKFDWINEIPTPASGKYRYTISTLFSAKPQRREDTKKDQVLGN